jgi:hypothetical protein
LGEVRTVPSDPIVQKGPEPYGPDTLTASALAGTSLSNSLSARVAKKRLPFHGCNLPASLVSANAAPVKSAAFVSKQKKEGNEQ